MSQVFRTILLGGLFLSQLSSCSKSDNTEPVDVQLTGNWEWTRTDGGIANNIHDTPASTGQHLTLTINPDNTYKIVVNDTLKSEGRFSIETRQCIHDHEAKQYLQFEHDAGRMVESLDSSVLRLSDEAYDGVEYEYHRAGHSQPN